MKKLIILLCFIANLLYNTSVFASSVVDEKLFNCYTIIAGKNTTTDGSVLVGHNEDDWGEQLLSMYIVPRRNHTSGDMLEVEGNASIPELGYSAKYFWVQMMAQHYADVYMNEHGVAVVSNRCASREDREDYTDGGISYSLRRAIAERAKSAQDAVRLIGELVEKYGYSSTGRTYSVADKNEAWVVAIVQGRHWIAQRVSDDQVMVIPNYYTIDKIDLNDNANFRGSRDIVSYAIERGWYNPEKDGEFSFRKVYSDSGTLNSSNNKGRKWGGLRLLSSTKYDINDEFPFQFTPKSKMDVETIINVLSDHFEGTDMDRVKLTNPGEPHSKKGSICNLGTQSSTVFQLRDLPAHIGAIMWTAMYSPCRQVYLPWYMGTDYLPVRYSTYGTANDALENHYKVKKDFRKTFPLAAYWSFLDYSQYIGENYVERMDKFGTKLDRLQDKVFSSFVRFDKNIQSEYKFMKLKSSYNSDNIAAKKMGNFTRAHHKKLMKIVQSR